MSKPRKFSEEEIVAALEHALSQAEDRERDLSNQLAQANAKIIELVHREKVVTANLKRWFNETFVAELAIEHPNKDSNFGNLSGTNL